MASEAPPSGPLSGGGPQQRSPTTMLLVMGAMFAAYYGYEYFFAQPSAPVEVAADPATLTPEDRELREAEARRELPERLAQARTATITTEDMIATIDNLGGGLTHVELLGERYRVAEAAMDLVSTDREEYRPLRIDLPGIGIPPDAVWELRQDTASAVELRWEGKGVEVVRRIEAGTGPYQLWQTVQVRNLRDTDVDTRLRVSTWHYVSSEHEGGGMFGNRSAGMSEALCRHEGETERKSGEDLYTRHGYRAPEFVAVENVYFVQALAPNGEPAEMCGLHASSRAGPEGDHAGTLYEGSLVYPVVELDPGEEHSWRTLAYVGPKVQGALENAGHSLTEVVNLGMFATIARWFAVFLTWIASHVGNWGLAIIILTICVRLVLFPLNERSFRSMARIRKLKPEMDEINARFSGDAEKKNAAIMELYRKHGINPLAQLGGCLPLLLQMPVFFALYTSLSTNIDLYHRPFVLYWQDLSAHDPYFVLPLMLGALMWLQQKLTPTAMDPAQARVMQIMPVIMTVFMLFLPSGLCLYMVTNSILSMSQQRLNEWRLGREQAVAATAVDGGAPVEDDAVKDTDRNGAGGKTAPATRGPGRSRRG